MNRHLAYGLAFVGLLALLTAGVVALYRGDLNATVPVSIEAGRAGLTMEEDAVVKLRGVEVGRVASISPADDGAEIRVEIDADRVDDVPADVTAQIVPPTAFGAKYVQLTAAAERNAKRIAAGDVITADYVTVEVNDAFSRLVEVLDAARPSEVNNALTALSTALDGRGTDLNALIGKTDEYLASFNATLPSLTDVLERSAGVVDTYDQALPDLLAAGKNATTTSRTILDQQASLHAFLLSLRSFSTSAEALIDDSEADLTRTFDLLREPTRVVARYSPELPCLIQGAQITNEWTESVIGGKRDGLSVITQFQPGDEPYRTPENLPILGNDSGPACFGLPRVTKADVEAPNPVLDTNANPYQNADPTPSDELSKTLFGTLSGLVNFLG